MADDGIATTSSAGLRVAASDTNPVTGEPAFAAGGTNRNEFDHTKWMADTRHVSSNSYPGFDAVPGQVLSCTMWAQGQAFGTEPQPYGSAVGDPESELRLASFAMNTIDSETGMVFDVWMTNTKIYPYYERLNLEGAAYHAFSSFFPGVPRVTNDDNVVTVADEPSGGVVRWIINGVVAAVVDKIGFPSPQATLVIDRGGTAQLAAPRQLNCGMAFFTLVDGGLPPIGEGLVSLGGSYVFPTSFVGGPTLFGQGVEMQVRKFEVRSSEPGS